MSTQSRAKPVWIDCDPGHDDAMALILAGYNPAVNLLGVSTVAGNQTVVKTTQNAIAVLAAAGLAYVRVCQGQEKPIIRSAAILCPEIHGDSGLDGPEGACLLPPPLAPRQYPRAVPEMFAVISAHYAERRDKVQLVATGALSNVALLIMLYPEIVQMVEITIMGGCMGIGNTGSVVEFNIQTDPEAAKVVFEAGAVLHMMPLEVTHTALATPEILEQLCPAGNTTPFRTFIRDLLLFFSETYETVFGFESPPLHDPTAVAYAIDASFFEMEFMRVDIETQSELSSMLQRADGVRRVASEQTAKELSRGEGDGRGKVLASLNCRSG